MNGNKREIYNLKKYIKHDTLKSNKTNNMDRPKGNYIIKIVVTNSDNDEEVCKGHSLSFESAEGELAKLEKYVNKVEEYDNFMRLDDEKDG